MVRQFIFDVFQNTNGFTNFTVDQINMIIPIKGAVYNNSKKSTRFYLAYRILRRQEHQSDFYYAKK